MIESRTGLKNKIRTSGGAGGGSRLDRREGGRTRGDGSPKFHRHISETSSIKKTRVVVAMSGGVDSSVAALLLTQQGYEVVGISMRLWSYEQDATHGCCTPEDLYDARKVADQLGIPHYICDFEASFEENVVSNFVDSYRLGETPNPCVRCNNDIKFHTLLSRASELGAKFLATGHYARREEKNGRFALMRAADLRRDQSYFLFGMGQEELSRILFPLGELKKEEVRRLATQAKLCVANKPDSQEICFVPKNYSEFVQKRLTPDQIRPGKIRNEKGEEVGAHTGIHQFTVGQRKGLRLQTQLPTYVLSIDTKGDVVVGPDQSLFKSTFEVRETRWVGDPPQAGEELKAQIRSRFHASKAKIDISAAGKVKATFEIPQRAITPGQAAVFYRGDQVVGGGWIERVVE